MLLKKLHKIRLYARKLNFFKIQMNLSTKPFEAVFVLVVYLTLITKKGTTSYNVALINVRAITFPPFCSFPLNFCCIFQTFYTMDSFLFKSCFVFHAFTSATLAKSG